MLLPPSEPMTESDIADTITAYARSAALAQTAGFDAIALHGAHGYLIDTFLWGETNRRTDRYGGDPVGRTRFAVEVVEAVRAAIGPDMPIIFRFSQWKQQDFEATLAACPAELEQILGPIAAAGVDVFDASTRNFKTPAFAGSPLNLAGWAKKLTGKASMTVGGVGLDKEIYDSFVNGCVAAPLQQLVDRFTASEFDLVGVGRALIGDPFWVDKVRLGEPRHGFCPAMLADIS
jgi:2,4-dienoyl-CoA reductase-like NADH-dependent reductase (Old Yellow Enzyme family)